MAPNPDLNHIQELENRLKEIESAQLARKEKNNLTSSHLSSSSSSSLISSTNQQHHKLGPDDIKLKVKELNERNRKTNVVEGRQAEVRVKKKREIEGNFQYICAFQVYFFIFFISFDIFIYLLPPFF